MNIHFKPFKRASTLCALALAFTTSAHAGEGNANTQTLPSTPLHFIKNVGQVKDQFGHNRNDVDFKASAGNIALFVGNGTMHYMWYKNIAAAPAPLPAGVHTKEGSPLTNNAPEKVESYRLDVTLVGADKNAVAAATGQKEYTERYYLPGVTDGAEAHSYGTVTYKNVYPNIDWVVYSKDNHIKYDFVVHPGGNPADIKLRYDGATSFNTENGAVTITTPMGTITEQKPYSYDAASGKEIASSFILNGNVLSFNTAPHTGTMVIDPTINWGTYYGATLSDAVNGMVVDATGNIWMALGTTSSNNLVSVGAYQNFLNGVLDGMLVMSDASGTMQEATYYGGPAADRFNALAIDGSGNIYCVGPTSSTTSIATAGTAQQFAGGNTNPNEFADGFMVKFNSSGQRLWATYYGGSSSDVIVNVAVDGLGNVYGCGTTLSSNAIATPGTFQTSLYAGQDGFVVKLSQSNGTRVWGTYYGGEANEELHSIMPDGGTGVYVCGWTSSANNIATVGAHQTTNPSSGSKATGWFAKMNSTGTLAFGTFYGGSDEDFFTRLALDGTNSVCLVGYSFSSNNIASTNAYQANNSGGKDCILAKFSTSGVRQWGTYFGGFDLDDIRGIYINSKGFIHFAGYTQSSGLATPGAYKTSGGGNGYYDGLWGQFSPAGQLTYCSYYGGNDLTQIMATAQGINGEILLSGYTRSTIGIATPSGWQTVHGGTEDAFLASFKADTLVYLTNPLNASYCGGATLNVPYTVNNIFKAGNTFTAQLSDALGNFATPTAIGNISATNDGSISCTIPTGVTAGTQYRIRIIGSNPVCTSAINNINITLNPTVAPTVQIVTTPGTTVGPYKQVSMTVNATNGGLNPTFQWKKNGQAIPGATTAFLTLVAGVDFISGDQITVDLTSDNPCANPGTVSSTATSLTINLGVNDIAKNSNIRIYPNPTSGNFTITGIANAEQITITDVMGKVVYNTHIADGNTVNVALPATLPNGLYLLKVQTATGELQSKLSLQR